MMKADYLFVDLKFVNVFETLLYIRSLSVFFRYLSVFF